MYFGNLVYINTFKLYIQSEQLTTVKIVDNCRQIFGRNS